MNKTKMSAIVSWIVTIVFVALCNAHPFMSSNVYAQDSSTETATFVVNPYDKTDLSMVETVTLPESSPPKLSTAVPTETPLAMILNFVGYGIYDDRVADIAYSGSWIAQKVKRNFLKTETYSNVIGSSARFAFTGENISVIYRGYPKVFGNMEVRIDGIVVATINQNTTAQALQKRWSSSNLGSGNHTLTLTHMTGTYVTLDGIIVSGPPTATPTASNTYTPTNTRTPTSTATPSPPVGYGTYDERSAEIVYYGSWVAQSISGNYLNTEKYSNVIGSGARFTFTGENISVIYRGYPNVFGNMEVRVDGIVVATINQNTSAQALQKRWSSTNLGSGTHTLTLTHMTGTYVTLDGIIVSGPLITIAVRTSTPTSPLPSSTKTYTRIPTNVNTPSLTPTRTVQRTSTPVTSKTPVNIVTSIAPGKPGYLEAIIDPAYGSKIIRVVDDTWGEVCRHHYSKDQAWNADQTVIWINKGCDVFIDGNTYAALPNLKFPPDSGGEGRWHPTNPKAIIYIKNDTLGQWNPFTGENIILHVFSGYTDLFIGPSEGNLTNDGSMIALYSTTSKKGFAYDITRNIKYPDIDFSAESRVNSVSISALGKYIIANVNNDNAKIFDLQGNQIGNTWSEYGCPSHYDFTVDQNGDEVAVGVCKTGYKGIVKRRLSDGQITVIFSMGASHTSARNIRRPGWVYVTGLYYAPYLNEILAIKLDGTAFERIAFIPNNKADYESEMHGSPSLDGTKVIVASNWNIGTRPVQAYVVEVVR
jgi:hypothetical protein